MGSNFTPPHAYTHAYAGGWWWWRLTAGGGGCAGASPHHVLVLDRLLVLSLREVEELAELLCDVLAQPRKVLGEQLLPCVVANVGQDWRHAESIGPTHGVRRGAMRSGQALRVSCQAARLGQTIEPRN